MQSLYVHILASSFNSRISPEATSSRIVATDCVDHPRAPVSAPQKWIVQVLRIDCRDPCHERLDKARLVHYISCEIIRSFGMHCKMPDRPGLSNGYGQHLRRRTNRLLPLYRRRIFCQVNSAPDDCGHLRIIAVLRQGTGMSGGRFEEFVASLYYGWASVVIRTKYGVLT